MLPTNWSLALSSQGCAIAIPAQVYFHTPTKGLGRTHAAHLAPGKLAPMGLIHQGVTSPDRCGIYQMLVREITACQLTKEMFTVYEVRRGAEYGCLGQQSSWYFNVWCTKLPRFCFGRIKFKGQEKPETWVVLGLLIEATGQRLNHGTSDII